MEAERNGCQCKQPGDVSVSAVLTYSAEVMVGKVVLMQPRLNSIHRAEGNTTPRLPAGYASRSCHCNYSS